MLEMWEENPNHLKIYRQFLLYLSCVEKLFIFMQGVISKPLPTIHSCLILASFFIILSKYGRTNSSGLVIPLFMSFFTWCRKSRYIWPKFPLSFLRLPVKSSTFTAYIHLTSFCIQYLHRFLFKTSLYDSFDSF